MKVFGWFLIVLAAFTGGIPALAHLQRWPNSTVGAWYEIVPIVALLFLIGDVLTHGQTTLIVDSGRRTVTKRTGTNLIPFRRSTRRWADFTEIVMLEETHNDEGLTIRNTLLRLTGPQHTMTWDASDAHGFPLDLAHELAELMNLPLRDETGRRPRQVR